MSLQITDFMSSFGGMGAGLSLNHFMVNFSPPSGNSSIGSTFQSMANMNYLCEACPLPGLEITTTERSMPYGYGPNYKMPLGAVFNDLNLRFIGDAEGYVHNVMTNWLNNVVTTNVSGISDTSQPNGMNPWLVNYLDDISATMNIYAYDVIGNQVITYNIYKAYPKYIADIEGDWAAQDQLVRIPVKFNFVNWQVSYAQSSQSAIPSSIQTLLGNPNQPYGITAQQLSLLNPAQPGLATTSPAFSSLASDNSLFINSISSDAIFI